MTLPDEEVEKALSERLEVEVSENLRPINVDLRLEMPRAGRVRVDFEVTDAVSGEKVTQSMALEIRG